MLHRARLALLLATLFALRALVPIGYMLQLPAGGLAGGPALVLCPVQNPELDLSLLAGAGDPHAHHHHGSDNPAAAATIEVDRNCDAWAGSAGAPVAHAVPPLQVGPPRTPSVAPPRVALPVSTARSAAQPRAPPRFLV